MSPFDEEEFWKALGRVYDMTVALDDGFEELDRVTQEHERRLDAAEVTIQAILDDLKRLRDRN